MGRARSRCRAWGSRYFSVAFMDMYTNNFGVVGTRTTGGDGGTFMVVGPAQATTDPLAIRAPTNWVWTLVRLLIDGDAHLAEANALQDAITVVATLHRDLLAATPCRSRSITGLLSFGRIDGKKTDRTP